MTVHTTLRTRTRPRTHGEADAPAEALAEDLAEDLADDPACEPGTDDSPAGTADDAGTGDGPEGSAARDDAPAHVAPGEVSAAGTAEGAKERTKTEDGTDRTGEEEKETTASMETATDATAEADRGPAATTDAGAATEAPREAGDHEPGDGAGEEPVSADAAAAAAAAAFDLLHARHAAGLTRQAFLLCGHRRVAARAVEHAFRLAWERWPEVASDGDPVGWLRAAAYEYALSPWHRFHPSHRAPQAYPGQPEDRELLDGLLSLPPVYRRSLVLADAVGLGVRETAAEAEATTGATARRLARARAALAGRIPEPYADPERTRDPELTERLNRLAAAQPVDPLPAPRLRAHSERASGRWVWASLLLLLALAVPAVLTTLSG
ncbi:hypothetical protein GCM10009716_35670 [Streptomyces sodiiphilus]|uniref:RNA polymerase subunit sigma-70 n=1 Tax=Streptomyces sodiiphilus TaxID=226217 RepID=A0ABP5AW92_9ACTN